MLRKLKPCLYLSIVVASLCSSITAVPTPMLDLPALTKNSSLIAVGKVISVRDIGPEVVLIQGQQFSGKRRLAELQVSRALKGQAASQVISFEFVTTKVYMGFGDVFVNNTGMFFLSQKSPRNLSVTDNYYPFVVAATTPPSASGSDYQRVIAEVANVLSLPQTTTDEKIKAISVLRPIVTPDTTNSLRVAANNTDMKVKLNAVAALLRRNDLTKLELVEKTLLQVSSGADPSSIGALLSSLEEIRDSKAIPTLTRLQSSNSANVRRSATYALRRIGTTVVLRPLMKALYDTDREVRYQAVIGLAVITEQYSWGPSIDGFQSNEQRYLTHWREWAKNH